MVIELMDDPFCHDCDRAANTQCVEERHNVSKEKDLVAEARALLASGAVQLPLYIEGWHRSTTDGGWFIRHVTGRILATVEFVPVEIETGRPALDGNAPARAIVALLNAVPSLCDEVERLREIEERYNEAVSSGLILDED